MPLNKGRTPYFGGCNGCYEGVTCRHDLKMNFLPTLDGLNPSVAWWLSADSAWLVFEFSRKFRGLVRLNLCFGAYFLPNSRENLKNKWLWICRKSLSAKNFRTPKPSMKYPSFPKRQMLHPCSTHYTLQNRVHDLCSKALSHRSTLKRKILSIHRLFSIFQVTFLICWGDVVNDNVKVYQIII